MVSSHLFYKDIISPMETKTVNTEVTNQNVGNQNCCEDAAVIDCDKSIGGSTGVRLSKVHCFLLLIFKFTDTPSHINFFFFNLVTF